MERIWTTASGIGVGTPPTKSIPSTWPTNVTFVGAPGWGEESPPAEGSPTSEPGRTVRGRLDPGSPDGAGPDGADGAWPKLPREASVAGTAPGRRSTATTTREPRIPPQTRRRRSWFRGAAASEGREPRRPLTRRPYGGSTSTGATRSNGAASPGPNSTENRGSCGRPVGARSA